MQLSTLFSLLNEKSYSYFKTHIQTKNKDNYQLIEYNDLELSILVSTQKIKQFKNANTSRIIINQTLPSILAFDILYDKITNITSKNINWDNAVVTLNKANSINVCLFWNNNNWLLHFSDNIINLGSEPIKKIHKLFNYATSSYDFNKLNTSYKYYLTLYHNSINKILHKDSLCDPFIYLIMIYDSNFNKINNDCIFPVEPSYKVSSYQELISLTDIMNQDIINTKIINNIGYKIYLFTQEKNITTLQCYEIITDMYNILKTIIGKETNIHKVCIELYKKDMLINYLHYLHKYPYDIIQRINSSFKTCAKEITNIYHITRNKKNSDLYEILPKLYKKILYNIHNIYVKSDEKYKKSITWSDIYHYIKYDDIDIIELFKTRNQLLLTLKSLPISLNIENILFPDCTDIITLLALVNEHY
jgi:hypothetical protein